VRQSRQPFVDDDRLRGAREMRQAGSEEDPVIRQATPADHQSWLVLWHGYQTFYKVAIDEATTAATWQRFLDEAEPMWCAVAELGGKPVGIVHYLSHRSTWTSGNYCYLQDLFVDPGLRARGIGRALIRYVYERAADIGCSRVWWLTHEGNTDAMKLYDQVADRSGFIQYRKLF
jgi:GNAT superfamily N-acetyltransferase